MPKKKVRLKDIADELNTSVVSVSNALNGKKGVSEQLRRKVLEAAEKLGYDMGRQVSDGSETVEIGVLIAERYVQEDSSFYMDIYRMLAQAATKKGCVSVLEIVSREKERMILPFVPFSGVNVQGVIVIGEMETQFIRYVNELGL